MEFKGRYVIPAPPDAVWEALNDPVVLKDCIPGCEALEKLEPTRFTATARLKIGPMSATFKGNVVLSDLEPPRHCVLTGEGQGGAAGFAKGRADVFLDTEGDGTVLTYNAKATVGGKLAQIGQRLIDGVARQIADQFFSRFASEVSATHSPSSPHPETALATPPQIVQGTSRSIPIREGLVPEIWVVGLVAIIVILLILFGLVL